MDYIRIISPGLDHEDLILRITKIKLSHNLTNVYTYKTSIIPY